MDIVLVGHIVDIVLVGLAVHTMLFYGVFTFFPDMTLDITGHIFHSFLLGKAL